MGKKTSPNIEPSPLINQEDEKVESSSSENSQDIEQNIEQEPTKENKKEQAQEKVQEQLQEQVQEQLQEENTSQTIVNTFVVEEKDTEEYRLGGRSPFLTIVSLMIGPILSQIAQSLYGLMDSYWISKTIGQKGMATMSLVSTIDFIYIAISQYLSCAMSARISYMIGCNESKDKCGQVVVDLFRIELIIGVFVPIILIPCVKPMIRWYGGDEEVVQMSFDYLLPLLCCGFINYTYLSLCGLLEAMGNSMIFGIAQVSSAMLNMFVFDPLFLLVFKTGMIGVAFATVLSNITPLAVLYIMLFMGKFNIKPKFKFYIEKFNPHSIEALKVSLSQLIANFATALPDLVLAKLVSMAAKRANMYEETMAAWNVLERLDEFSMCVCNGLDQGYLPAASFAFGRKDLHRLSRMALITTLIGTTWTSLCCILITTIPKTFARIWGDNELFIEVASKILVICFASCFLNQIILTTTATLQAMKMVTLSISSSILTMMVPIPIFGFILYYTNNSDPIRLIYSFICQDIWAILLTTIIIIWKLRFIFTEKGRNEIENDKKTTKKEHKGETSNDEEYEVSEYETSTEDSLSNPLISNKEKL